MILKLLFNLLVISLKERLFCNNLSDIWQAKSNISDSQISELKKACNLLSLLYKLSKVLSVMLIAINSEEARIFSHGLFFNKDIAPTKSPSPNLLCVLSLLFSFAMILAVPFFIRYIAPDKYLSSDKDWPILNFKVWPFSSKICFTTSLFLISIT